MKKVISSLQWHLASTDLDRAPEHVQIAKLVNWAQKMKPENFGEYLKKANRYRRLEDIEKEFKLALEWAEDIKSKWRLEFSPHTAEYILISKELLKTKE